MGDYELRVFDGEAAFPDAYDVREAVFIEEQGVSEDIEMDGNDDEATHVVCYDDGYPVGTARVRFVDADTAKAERVAVRADYRGDGLGRLLMDALEDEARTNGCTHVELHAQTAVEGFYQHLGYETVGDEFMEANIPHVEMIKDLQ